jgi:hypothetical protein
MVFLSGKNEVSADFSVNFQKSAYIAYDCKVVPSHSATDNFIHGNLEGDLKFLAMLSCVSNIPPERLTEIHSQCTLTVNARFEINYIPTFKIR